MVFAKTYTCGGERGESEWIVGGKTPFCLDGNCLKEPGEANDEMLQSVAQMGLLKELQGQGKNPSFFKGSKESCSRAVVGFKDCCGKGKGWGTSLKFSSCSSNEKLLASKRKENLCHYVGTYCARKVLGKCLKKKQVYCCFGSKLLRVFQEQGRKQLGLGWGKAKKPICRGFSATELQKIDFSKLDLREVFEDILRRFQPSKAKPVEAALKERMKTLKKEFAK